MVLSMCVHLIQQIVCNPLRSLLSLLFLPKSHFFTRNLQLRRLLLQRQRPPRQPLLWLQLSLSLPLRTRLPLLFPLPAIILLLRLLWGNSILLLVLSLPPSTLSPSHPLTPLIIETSDQEPSLSPPSVSASFKGKPLPVASVFPVVAAALPMLQVHRIVFPPSIPFLHLPSLYFYFWIGISYINQWLILGCRFSLNPVPPARHEEKPIMPPLFIYPQEKMWYCGTVGASFQSHPFSFSIFSTVARIVAFITLPSNSVWSTRVETFIVMAVFFFFKTINLFVREKRRKIKLFCYKSYKHKYIVHKNNTPINKSSISFDGYTLII